MKDFSLSFDRDIIEVGSIDGFKEHIYGLSSTTLDLSIISNGEMIYTEGKDLLFDLDMFRSMTVRQLFKAINKKIKDRDA